ncbi:hypothetical protein V8C86DRAFT_3213784 [Haematococcus lacustris]
MALLASRPVGLMSATCSRPASARPARLAAPCSSRARSLRVMAQVLAFSGQMLGDDGTARHAVKIDETAKQVNPVIPAFTRCAMKPLAGMALFNGIGAAFPNSPTWLLPQNELFVGRAGMLGFLAAVIAEVLYNKGPWAMDPNILINKPGQALGMTRPGFSRQNELFVGRAGMLGFLAAVIAEVLYNKGPWAMVASFIGQTPDDGYYRLIGYGLGISAIAVTVLGYTLDNGGEDDTGKDIY